jgi:type VI secretion system protein ImpM
VSLDPSAAGILDGDGETAVQMAVGSPPRLAPVLLQVLAHRLAAVYEPLTLWWTDGSAAVEPSGLICRGLPDPESFASLLDGAWTGRRWWAIPSHAVDPAPEDESPGADEGPVTLRSAAASDAGRVRAINQDAFLERPDLGIWVVADGLGGHADGEIASRMVCDAFAGLGGEPTLEALIEAGTERLHQVNGHLVRAALRSRDGARSGSTVAALLVRGSRLAAVWAGDSRVYRWRDGQLAQVTRDHNLAAAGETLATGDANVVTRAVGGENTLELDVRRDRARPGDRYLLCSDGLTRTVPDSRIESWMASGDAPAVVRGLVDAALAAGAPDNVTVVVVDVSP